MGSAGGRALLLSLCLLLSSPAALAAPIRYCVDPDWPPYEVINQAGIHEGIAADLLQLAADRAGLELVLVPTKDWDESIAAVRRGDCALLDFLNQTPKREEWLVFTDPLFIDPNVVITREEQPFVADLAALSDKTIVLPRGTAIEERVRQDFPNLRIVTTNSEAEAFEMVSTRKADLTIRSMMVAVHTIKKQGWFNLKVSGLVPGYENKLRIGIAKDRADLRDALNPAIATITAQERNAIANRHVSINVQTGVDYALIANIVAVFLAILLSNLLWAMKLRKVNRQLRLLSRRDGLTGLHNRIGLDEQLAAEMERAVRHATALSIIIIDLDHFKAVNDNLGHLMGDRVLTGLADILRQATRASDTAGRWGGEEFLILCPHADGSQALAAAERICAMTRSHSFFPDWRQTVSAGVAQLQEGESMGSLLRRADAALYRVKNSGRDRACLDETATLLPPAAHA